MQYILSVACLYKHTCIFRHIEFRSQAKLVSQVGRRSAKK